MNLFIDTHLNDVVVILEKDNKIIEEEIIKNEKQNSKVIMPTIKKVLNGTKPDSIIVVNGPGSFTGVRLGVTIAKTLAYTMNIPIRTISSLLCMASMLDERDSIVAFSDNNGYYIGEFNNKELVKDYIYLKNDEFASYSNNHKVITDVDIDYLEVIQYALTKEPINPHKVNPIYIKKLDVEK